MYNFLRRVLNNESKDPLIKALYDDESLLSDIKNVLLKKETDLEFSISTAEKLHNALNNIELQIHSTKLPEIQLLSCFLSSLFEIIKKLPNDSENIKKVSECVYFIIFVIDGPPEIKDPQNVLISLVKLYSFKLIPVKMTNNILNYFLQSKSFIASIANSEFFAAFANEIFVSEEMKDGLVVLNKQIQIMNNFAKFKIESLNEIISIFISKIPEIPQTSLVASFTFFINFAHIFIFSENATKYFLENNGVALVIKYANEEDLPLLLALSAKISPDHLGREIIEFLFFQIKQAKNNLPYVAVFKHILTFREYELNEIESVKPIETLFVVDNKTTDFVTVLVEIFAWVAFRKDSKTVKYAEELYDRIMVSANDDTRTLFFDSLENYVMAANRFKELKDTGFVQIFVLNNSSLKDLIENDSFLELLAGIYRESENSDEKWRLIVCLFEKGVEPETIGKLFSIDTDELLMKNAMKFLQQKDSSNLSMLVSSFRDKENANVFCECKGLIWLDQFENIDEQLYYDLIYTLINDITEDRISNWVYNLNEFHRLFKLGKERLYNLCYKNKKICIPSLLPLVDFKEKISREEVEKTAKIGVASFIKYGIYNSPILDKLANAYCSPNDFVNLLNNHPHVDCLVKKCYDIPLYEFSKGTGTYLKLLETGKAISFWVNLRNKKTVHSIFSSQYASGRVVSNVFTFQFEDDFIHTPIKISEWFMVTIAIGEDSKSIHAFINNTHFVHQMENIVEDLGEFVFGSMDDVLTDIWFLSSSIIIYNEFPVNIEKIYRVGPTIIPNSSHAKVLSQNGDLTVCNNVRNINPSGFGFFFNNRFNMFLLYEKMMEAEDPEPYIRCALKIAEKSSFLWYAIILVIKSKDLKKELLKKIATTAFESSKLGMFINDLEIMHRYAPIILDAIRTGYLPVYEELSISIALRNNNSIIEICSAIAEFTRSSSLYQQFLNISLTSEEEVQIRIIKAISINVVSRDVFTLENFGHLMMTCSPKVAEECMVKIIEANIELPDYIKYSPTFVFSLVRCFSHKTWAFVLSIITATSNLETDDLKKTFSKLDNVRPSFIPTAVSLILACITAIVASKPNTPEWFENDLFDAMNVFTSYARYDVDLFNTEVSFKSIEFFGKFAFDISGLTALPDSVEEKDFPIIDFFNKMWSLPEGCVKEPKCEFTPVSYCSVIKYLVEKTFNAQFSVPNGKSGFDIFPTCTSLVNIYTEFITAFCYDNEMFNTILHTLISQRFSKNELQIGDIALQVITSIFAKSEFYTAPLEVFITTFNFVSELLYEGLVVDIYLMFSSLLPSLAAIFKSPQLQGASNNERITAPLRNILLYVFDLNCTEAEPTFELINSLSDFLYYESGIFDLDYTLMFLFKIAQYSITKHKELVVATTISFLDFALKNEAFIAKWYSLTDISMDSFANGIRSSLNGHNTDSFYNGLSFLADYISNLDLWEPQKKEEKEIDLSFNTAFIKDYFLVEKFCKTEHSVNDECETIISSIIMRFMEHNIGKFWEKCVLFSKQKIENFKPESYTLNPITWPFDVPRVNAPLLYPLPVINEENRDKSYDFNIKETELEFKFKNPIDLSDSNLIPYFSSFPISCTPLSFRYTGTSNPTALNQMFIASTSHLGKIKYAFKVMFRRMSDPIPSVVFVFDKMFLILIGAELNSKGGIKLLKTSTPALARNLFQEITEGFFNEYFLFCGHFVLNVDINRIINWKYHLHLHQQFAIEFNCLKTGVFILIYDGQFPSNFIKDISSNISYSYGENSLFQIPLSQATSMWKANALSTYDYLLILNSFGGRSFADLSQYPVFPWIIGDYTSKGKIKKYRNLSLPMGQQDAERAKLFMQSYNGEYLYGSHYSMSAGVHFYMIRSPPFTYFDWDLHSGWDSSSRLFFDIGYSWESASKLNTNDVKELIPELFSVPECLMNVSNLPLENVVLPPWCKNAVNFIFINREELEASQIDAWIDLIFGYQQTGSAANAILNIFLPSSYHNIKADDDEKEMLMLRLEHWGQCPIQLFKKQHCGKNPLSQQKLPSLNILSERIPPTNIKTKFVGAALHLISPALKTYFVLCDPLFIEGMSVAFSANGSIMTIVFSVGIVNSYCIKYDKGKTDIKKVIKLSSFNYKQEGLMEIFDENTQTVPDGRDFLCATFCRKYAVVWDACRGTVHRYFEMNEKILNVSFDEDFGLIWFVTRNFVIIKTINGLDVCEYENMGGSIVCSCPIRGKSLSMLISTENRNILMLTLDKKKLAVNVDVLVPVQSKVVKMEETSCNCVDITNEDGETLTMKVSA